MDREGRVTPGFVYWAAVGGYGGEVWQERYRPIMPLPVCDSVAVLPENF